MKTKAAVVYEPGKPIEIEELEVSQPQAGEVLVRFLYAGLCHSDYHVAIGHLDCRLPLVLGHEGAGVVEEVGPGVTRVKPGDHIVASFIPSCGTCRYCATGRQSICDWGANALDGCLPTGRYPLTGPAGEYGAMDMLGTFSEYGVLHEYSCIKIEDYYPLDKAVLVSCGVPTGWGSAVNTADVRPGQTVVIIGIGGIGINAVQGAVMAGAKHVIAVDLLESKRDFAIKFGATHAFASVAEAMDTIAQVTWGQMADAAIITPGIMTKEVVTDGFDSVGKGGKVVMTALTRFDTTTIELPGTMLTVYRKEIRGSLFGDCNPTTDIPRLLNLYDSGDLKIDELVTQTYSLEQVNQGYADLIDGKNMRGIIAFDR